MLELKDGEVSSEMSFYHDMGFVIVHSQHLTDTRA